MVDRTNDGLSLSVLGSRGLCVSINLGAVDLTSSCSWELGSSSATLSRFDGCVSLLPVFFSGGLNFCEACSRNRCGDGF